MNTKQFMRASNTVVSSLQIFRGDISTAVVGAPGSGKNIMLYGLMTLHDPSEVAFIATEMNVDHAASHVPQGTTVYQSRYDNFNSLFSIVCRALQAGQKCIFIEHLNLPVAMQDMDYIGLLEDVVSSHGGRLVFGQQEARKAINKKIEVTRCQR
ncbi:hypothetical protein VPHF86_0176 [Vibrio phage F86]